MKKFFVLMAVVMVCLIAGPGAFAAVNITTDVTTDTTWGDVDNEYFLNGPVFVKNNATLTILPGTTVYGVTGGLTVSALIVERGSKLVADGAPDAPIVFKSDAATPGRGQWGGLIINGYAPINNPLVEMSGEGDTGLFGGENPHDNSGILRYVRVESGGFEFSPDNELNGIALQAVGDCTVIDHVQVHLNKDDGIEMFGGTVNSKYVLCTGIGDDSFDWTLGWSGKAQFWVAQQYGDDADQGIEADNWAEDLDARPRAYPTIYNMTLIGDPDTDLGTESDAGMLLREGTAAKIRNAIVIGFKEDGIDVDHAPTYAQAQVGNLTVDNSIFHNNLPNYSTSADDTAPPFTVADWMANTMQHNSEMNPFLIDPYNTAAPDFRPSPTSPAANGTIPVDMPDTDCCGGFFEYVDFIGGVDPDYDWTKEPWTTIGSAPANPVQAQILDVDTNLGSTARVGQRVRLTCKAIGPNGADIEYRFYSRTGYPAWTSDWTLVKNWSSSNFADFIFGVTGNHYVIAHVRVAGESWVAGDPQGGFILTVE